ncbi:MAG: hypothetical protein V3U45_03710 [bacterium]
MTRADQLRRQEARRLQVAILDAQGYGPSQIAKTVGASRPTVYKDLAEIEASSSGQLPAGRVAAQARAMANLVIRPLLPLMSLDATRDAKGNPDPGAVIASARTIWAVYKDRVLLEQALGTVPKEPEKVSLDVEFGKALVDLLDSISGRLSHEAGAEFAKALSSVHAEQTELAERLGLVR